MDEEAGGVREGGAKREAKRWSLQVLALSYTQIKEEMEG